MKKCRSIHNAQSQKPRGPDDYGEEVNWNEYLCVRLCVYRWVGVVRVAAINRLHLEIRDKHFLVLLNNLLNTFV